MQETIEKTNTKLALIAGYGELPIELARSAQAEGIEVVTIALNKKTYNSLKSITQCYQYSPVEPYKIVAKIKELGIQNVTFIGKVPKADFFSNIHKLEPKVFSEIKNLSDLNDDSLHQRVIKFME